MTVRWMQVLHRLRADHMEIGVPEWRTVLANSATVGTPQLEAKWATNWRDGSSANEDRARYYKDPFGVVRMTGSAERSGAGIANETIMSLPVDCIPEYDTAFLVPTAGNGLGTGFIAKIIVRGGLNSGGTAGNVDVNGRSSDANAENRIFLDISWRAGNLSTQGFRIN